MTGLGVVALVFLGLGVLFRFLDRWGSKFDRPGEQQSANSLKVRWSGPVFVAIGGVLGVIWLVRLIVPG